LNMEASEWRRFRQSRSYRVVDRYYSLYRHPIFGPVLITGRRIVHYLRASASGGRTNS
jgi:hypothetical protein